MRWLVDGMNVIGSRPDGWWRDRSGAARALAAALKDLAAVTGDEITVAFEGSAIPDLPPGPDGQLQVLYARRKGRDAADDRIVEAVAADPDPGSLTVVTSDRELARRVIELGAAVVGSSVFRSRLTPGSAGGSA
jgi:predicted RNA-binding protein with PIN domain